MPGDSPRDRLAAENRRALASVMRRVESPAPETPQPEAPTPAPPETSVQAIDPAEALIFDVEPRASVHAAPPPRDISR